MARDEDHAKIDPESSVRQTLDSHQPIHDGDRKSSEDLFNPIPI